jgi:protein SCO1
LRLLRDSENREASAIPWVFATARSQEALAPLLATMGQDISFEIDASGRRSGVINQMLKVFLIDPDGWVREIYSTAFLSPENLLNDARTLALAHPAATNR